MKISIITCTYNSAEFLSKNIQSVKDQTCKNFEHIFIDGFSNDGTVELIKEYQQKYPNNVKLIQAKAVGISHAMNEGIKNASGEYVIHLHSDDSFYDENVLHDVYTFLENKNLDWIYGMANVTEADGKSIGVWPWRKIFQNTSNERFGKFLLKFIIYIPHQAVFIKKEVFEKYGYFDESITTAMDADLWLRIYKKTTWSFINRIICNYSIRSDAASSGIKNKINVKRNLMVVRKRHLNFIENFFGSLLNFIISKIKNNHR